MSRKNVECFWSDGEDKSKCIRYETQIHILRQLMMLSKHFAAAAFSVEDEKVDPMRIVTMSAIAAIADFEHGSGDDSS